MATVKCISLEGDSLPDGRRLPPGHSADNVDVTTPAVLAKLEAGRLVVTTEDFDVPGNKVDDVIKWVGDDPERAAIALAAERSRPTGDPRSTLTDKLTELVETTDDSPQED